MKDSRYINIAQKMDDDPKTAPKTKDKTAFQKSFIEYLKLVYSPEEAEIIQYLNVAPALLTSQQIAEKSGTNCSTVEKILENANKKSGVFGMGGYYCLPSFAGLLNIHHFYTEIKPDDLRAAELYQDFFIKGEYYRYYESSEKGTQSLRTIPVGKAIHADQKTISSEEAHDYISNHAPEELALVPCPCRVRTEKMGIRECKNKFPIASCIMMGFSALHFESIGLGKRITRQQAIEYFDEMNELGLIGNTSNSIDNSNIICLCCGCCCSNVRGRTRWDNPTAVSPSNYIPKAGEDCLGCGVCVDACVLDALAIDDETDQVVVEPDKCIGCGVCTFACPEETLKLHRYERSTPFATYQELYDTIRRENRE
jgi:ferredoxin